MLVGHCLADQFMLKNALRRLANGSPVRSINDRRTLDAALAERPVLLVNRVLDGRFGTDSGIELIRELVAASPATAILISNFEEAQAEAVAAGAFEGFGKQDLYELRTARIVEEALSA
ncbi:MAG: hypothetical protein HKN62_00415 [Phycisphaerales bacterium]|nr:hypothetical protein [Phycisphaerales bacterium]